MKNGETWRLSLLPQINRQRIVDEITAVGADPYTCSIWDKGAAACIKVQAVPAPAANVIKQEALACGIDAAVHRNTINCKIDFTDILILGNIRGLKKLAFKLKKQYFGLAVLGEKIETALLPKVFPPRIMGILNVTPDSFSDGGRFINTYDMEKRIMQIIDEGADYIDIGGVSTRPAVQNGNETAPSAEEEIKRIIPAVKFALEAVKNTETKVSVDTFRSQVVKKCLELGVDMINDQSALADPLTAKMCAEAEVDVCLMHSGDKGGEGKIMNRIMRFAEDAVLYAERSGINREKIVIDPGFGFAKSVKENYTVLRDLKELQIFNCRIMAGVSRKSMLGKVTGRETDEREAATSAAESWAVLNGASIIRTHDVARCVDCVKILNFISEPGG